MMTIREFQHEDWHAVVAMDAEESPSYAQSTIEEWEQHDEERADGEHYLRLAAGEVGNAVGYMEITDLSTTAKRRDGVCTMDIMVFRAQRNQGIGSTLYERAIAYAQSRNAHRITAWATEFAEDDCSATFFKNRGFTIMDKVKGSSLDLATFDPAKLAGAEEKVEASGLRLFTYADLQDTEENRRKLYALTLTVSRDMPSNDEEGYVDPPFDDWIKRFERPQWDSQALVLAADGDKWVGITQLGFQEETNIANTWITGILSEYRGRGLATALKLRAIARAKERGCPLIGTGNHEDNAPMLAINRKFGFVPDPPWVCYSKDLTDVST